MPLTQFRIGWFAMNFRRSPPGCNALGIGNARQKWSASRLFWRVYLVNVRRGASQPHWVQTLRQFTFMKRKYGRANR